MENKNVMAIDKIISRLSFRDMMAAKSKQKGKSKQLHGYTLGDDTMEALDLKKRYVNDEITEEIYKVWCLRWNLSHTEMFSGKEYEQWMKFGQNWEPRKISQA